MAKYFFILLVTFNCILSQVLANSDSDGVSLKETKQVEKYNFLKDWVTRNVPLWEKVLSPFKGKPDIHYLEIGVFEGRSIIWMLENILTHSTSKATGIDTFPGNLKENFLANLKISGFADKVTTITGLSQIELRHLPLDSFDIIYIDACHTTDDTLADAVLSWPLLKNEGLLIFDDYYWKEKEDFPLELRPKIAIDAFITTYRNFIEVVHHNRQIILKKRKTISGCTDCFPIGQYVYAWEKKKLYDLDTKEPITLSETEKNLIEKLIKLKEFGKTEFSLDDKILHDEEFINLRTRLKIDSSEYERKE